MLNSGTHTKHKMATSESIRVIARFRPPFELEQKSQKTRKIDIHIAGKLLSLGGVEQHKAGNTLFGRKRKKIYTFDEIMDEKSKAAKLFEKIAQPMCDGILEGYNSTVITYGQSGSGKSYTMYGPEEKKDSMNIELTGIIPRSCCYIFGILKNKHHPLIEGMLSYEVKCEFLEIECNELKDLLDINNKPEIKERCVNRLKDKWVLFTSNSKQIIVNNYSQILKCINNALYVNGRSSKAHMIMNLFVKIQMANSERNSVFRFFDLEGSQKMKEKECLSRVIETLVEKKEAQFVESELTYLLKNSLGGNCKTALIVCCSPDLAHINETIRSLNFGVRCRTIQNHPKRNKVAKEHVLKLKCKKLERKNKELLKQIQELKDPNQVYVDIDVEKNRLIKEIFDLETHIKSQSNQIKELGKDNLIMDRAMEKHNDDCKQFECENKQLTARLNDRVEEMQRLKCINEQLKERNEELNVNNKRLKDSNHSQLIEMNKLKVEHINLENETKIELDNNKCEIIQSLKLQLVQIQYALKLKQNNIYELQDKVSKVFNNLNDSKSKSEQLIFDLKEKDKENNNILSKQSLKIKELLLDMDMKSNELESYKNTIEQIKKQHFIEINDLKYELGIMKDENNTFEMQCKQLQNYYDEVVQKQIEIDNKLAYKWQEKEAEIFKKDNNYNEIYITPMPSGIERDIVNKFTSVDDDKSDQSDDEYEPDMEAEQLAGIQQLIVRKGSNVLENKKQNVAIVINNIKPQKIVKTDSLPMLIHEEEVTQEDAQLAKAIYNSQVYQHNEYENRKRDKNDPIYEK